jgi:hypothetical protein
VTVEKFMDGRGEDAREVRRIRFKLINKIDALELLGKHHKLYIERHEHEFIRNGLADRLAAALARVGETPREVRSSRPTERSPAIATCDEECAASGKHCPKSAESCPSEVDPLSEHAR